MGCADPPRPPISVYENKMKVDGGVVKTPLVFS